jgi:manganese efflux pump family protein
VLALVVAAIAVGLDNFGAAIGIGSAHGRSRYRWQVAAVFGVFEAGMPVLGMVAGRAVAGEIAGVAPIIGGIVVGLMGVVSVIEALRQGSEASPERRPALGLGRLVLLGLVLSLDNLAVGFALGSAKISLVSAVAVIGVVSVALSLLGLELGGRLGERVGERGELVGGVALMVVGVLIGLGIS